MTKDEVKNLLNDLKLAKLRTEQCRRVWLRSKENVELLAAIDYTAARVEGGEKPSIQERFAERESAAQEKYLEACERQFDLEDKISALMVYLSPEERQLATDRFMDDVPLCKLHERYSYAMGTLRNKFSDMYTKMAR